MITLLTDFGTTDYFVAAMKGVILTVTPDTSLHDLTHEIPPQDIAAAAFTLGAAYAYFPADTIHLAVVDPGVGSTRRAIIVEAGKQVFVGPDNGLFSYVYAREKSLRVTHVTEAKFFRSDLSATFHGRDVFAPLAAWLAKGISPENFGVEIFDFVRLPIPEPQSAAGRLSGEVIHIDHFGNCITNLTAAELSPDAIPAGAKCIIQQYEVADFTTHFAGAQAGTLFAYLGSAGFWEVAVWQDSAARRFGIRRGAPIYYEAQAR